jgi:hypothetical protein
MIRSRMAEAGRVLLGTAMLAATIAAQGAYDTLLTVADVEKVAGATGVRSVPNGSQVGAGGMLNFVNGAGKLILSVAINTFYPGIGEHVKPVLTEA